MTNIAVKALKPSHV